MFFGHQVLVTTDLAWQWLQGLDTSFCPHPAPCLLMSISISEKPRNFDQDKALRRADLLGTPGSARTPHLNFFIPLTPTPAFRMRFWVRLGRFRGLYVLAGAYTHRSDEMYWAHINPFPKAWVLQRGMQPS